MEAWRLLKDEKEEERKRQLALKTERDLKRREKEAAGAKGKKPTAAKKKTKPKKEEADAEEEGDEEEEEEGEEGGAYDEEEEERLQASQWDPVDVEEGAPTGRRTIERKMPPEPGYAHRPEYVTTHEAESHGHGEGETSHSSTGQRGSSAPRAPRKVAPGLSKPKNKTVDEQQQRLTQLEFTGGKRKADTEKEKEAPRPRTKHCGPKK